MKKLIFLLIITLSFFCVSALAQSRPDYSGVWTLDKANSKMSADSRIESITITVWQKTGEIKIETATTLETSPDDAGTFGGPRVTRRSTGDGTVIYTPDGTEKDVELDTPSGKMPGKLKADFQPDGKLNLSAERTLMMSSGTVSILTTEIWELTNGGKTLKITRETAAPNGTRKNEMMFTKKSGGQ